MRGVLVGAAEALQGLSVWAVVAGPGTGSVINILLGDRVPRDRPLGNPTLPDEVRKNDASHSLFVQCVWRLDAADRMLTGAWDSNHVGGPMLAGLGALVGDRVKSVWVGRPALDLDVTFDSGATLRVFCDQVNEGDDQTNYLLVLPQQLFTVGCRSVVRQAARSG